MAQTKVSLTAGAIGHTGGVREVPVDSPPSHRIPDVAGDASEFAVGKNLSVFSRVLPDDLRAERGLVLVAGSFVDMMC